MRPTLNVIGGTLLLVVAAFMALGFALSDDKFGTAPTIIALGVTVALPAVFGVSLIVSQARAGRLRAQTEEPRLQTVESRILRLAEQRAGRVTLVEIVAELEVGAESAQSALDALVQQELADIAVSDDGVLVYAVRELSQSEKMRAKRLLES
jgi:hypothetical protein